MNKAQWFQEIALESWTEYTAIVSDGIRDGIDGVPISKIWFRGQGDSDWPLIASFDRTLEHLDSGTKADVYDCMVRAFRERAGNQIGVDKLGNSSLICLMQHFGAPTRVLDWSTSPYVAAYFAFASASNISGMSAADDDRCAVFLLNAQKKLFKGYGTLQLITGPPTENNRAWAQHGRFTLNKSTNADLTLELKSIYSNPVEQPKTWILRKLTIPRKEAMIAMKDLELMGLTSETLFPGLEGSAKYAFFRALGEVGILQR